MPHVSATAEGWQVVATGDVYTSLREALDGALAGVAAHEKPAYFRDADGAENGAYRWLPAVAEEDAPLRGVRIDATAVDEMAAHLNSSPRAIPIDGGTADSPAHGTMFDPGTKANGRGHWMVTALNASGKVEGYLWAELLPSVAVDVDSGRLGEGSVHIRFESLDGETPRGVEYASHALLNDPGVDTLAPANSVRAATTALRSMPMAGRSMASAKKTTTRAAGRGTGDMKTTLRAKLIEAIAKNLKTEAKRGPALDKLAEIARALGVDIDAEMSGDSWDSPISQAVSALKQMASAEKVLEGLPADAPAPDAARARALARSAVIAAALGLAEDASDEDIVAAIEKMKTDAKPDEPPAEDEAAKAAKEEAARSARTAKDLGAKVAELAAKVAEYEPIVAQHKARERDEKIDAACRAKGVTSAPSIARAREHAAEFGEAAALKFIAGIAAPPTGTIAQPTTSRSAAPESVLVAPSGEVDSDAATAMARAAVEAEQPALRGPALHQAVLARARKDHPKAFSRSAAKN
jgi:hypothetical protein